MFSRTHHAASLLSSFMLTGRNALRPYKSQFNYCQIIFNAKKWPYYENYFSQLEKNIFPVALVFFSTGKKNGYFLALFLM
jgi:hypothetical protein